MEYEELMPGASGDGGADLGRLQNVPVELAVEIGRTRMTIGEALALSPGSVVTVGRLAGDPVDLLVNGRVIARGEVVAVDEELGLRITEIAAAVVDGAGGDGTAKDGGNADPRVLSQREGGAAGADVLGPPPPVPPAGGGASASAGSPAGGGSSGEGLAGAALGDSGSSASSSPPLPAGSGSVPDGGAALGGGGGSASPSSSPAPAGGGGGPDGGGNSVPRGVTEEVSG